MVCRLSQVVLEAGAGALVSHLLIRHPHESAAISVATGVGVAVWRRHWFPIVLGGVAAAYLLSSKQGRQGA